MTLQRVFLPQAPGHGLMHFWLEHASLNLQSELTMHSGRQLGGLPTYPWTHTQTACPFTSLH